MHSTPLLFVRSILKTVVPTGPLSVLEVGSYDVNGSIKGDVRNSPLGPQLAEYIGVDLVEGPGVDLVASGSDLKFEDARFDLVMSLECFEHNPQWRETLENMVRMLKPGGLCIITCASLGRPEHGTTRMDPSNSPGTQEIGWDYYQNLSLSDFRKAIAIEDTFSEHTLQYSAIWNDLLFAGRKRGEIANLGFAGYPAARWVSAVKGSASVKRRITYYFERLLGSYLFQEFYVTVWRTFKPGGRSYPSGR